MTTKPTDEPDLTPIAFTAPIPVHERLTINGKSTLVMGVINGDGMCDDGEPFDLAVGHGAAIEVHIRGRRFFVTPHDIVRAVKAQIGDKP